MQTRSKWVVTEEFRWGVFPVAAIRANEQTLHQNSHENSMKKRCVVIFAPQLLLTCAGKAVLFFAYRLGSIVWKDPGESTDYSIILSSSSPETDPEMDTIKRIRTNSEKIPTKRILFRVRFRTPFAHRVINS
ncbi:hypothetical protein ACFE04_016259 [Oxalis oulophora]